MLEEAVCDTPFIIRLEIKNAETIKGMQDFKRDISGIR